MKLLKTISVVLISFVFATTSMAQTPLGVRVSIQTNISSSGITINDFVMRGRVTQRTTTSTQDQFDIEYYGLNLHQPGVGGIGATAGYIFYNITPSLLYPLTTETANPVNAISNPSYMTITNGAGVDRTVFYRLGSYSTGNQYNSPSITIHANSIVTIPIYNLQTTITSNPYDQWPAGSIPPEVTLDLYVQN